MICSNDFISHRCAVHTNTCFVYLIHTHESRCSDRKRANTSTLSEWQTPFLITICARSCAVIVTISGGAHLFRCKITLGIDFQRNVVCLRRFLGGSSIHDSAGSHSSTLTVTRPISPRTVMSSASLGINLSDSSSGLRKLSRVVLSVTLMCLCGWR